MPSAKQYEYKFLHSDGQNTTVRLLSFLPRTIDGEIAVSLEQVTLDYSKSLPVYTALSYTWGGDQDMRKIYIDGDEFLIRDNLWRCLNHCSTRLIDCPNHIWVDAICIDQANVAEKNAQVQLISSIISSAQKVMIWLGEASEDTTVSDYWYAESQSGLDVAYGEIFDAKLDDALSRVICNQYWKRLWIVQEVALARDLVVIAGTGLLEDHAIAVLSEMWADWIPGRGSAKRSSETATSFSGSFRSDARDSVIMQTILGTRHRSDLDSTWVKVHENRDHRQKWRNPVVYDQLLPSLDLADVTRRFCQQLCSDRRDKIYGLLGIAKDQHNILVDYCRSAGKLFLDFLAYFCRLRIHDCEPLENGRLIWRLVMELGITYGNVQEALLEMPSMHASQNLQELVVVRVLARSPKNGEDPARHSHGQHEHAESNASFLLSLITTDVATGSQDPIYFKLSCLRTYHAINGIEEIATASQLVKLREGRYGCFYYPSWQYFELFEVATAPSTAHEGHRKDHDQDPAWKYFELIECMRGTTTEWYRFYLQQKRWRKYLLPLVCSISTFIWMLDTVPRNAKPRHRIRKRHQAP